MSELKDALNRMIQLQNESMKNQGGPFILYGKEYMDALSSAIEADIPGTWDILENGTDEQFLEILNNYDVVSAFDTDEAMRNVMSIGKRRFASTSMDRDDFLQGLKVGFGVLFDRFWNETEPHEPPVRKAQTFSQLAQRSEAPERKAAVN